MSIMDQLHDLDPNDVSRWPASIRFGSIALLFLVTTAILVYFMSWSSKKPELDQARAQEQTLLRTVEERARKAANLEAYKVQLAEMEQSFGAMLRKLPNQTEVPNLLTDISQQGAAAGLEQQLFQPAPQINKDFYAELPIRMRLTGSFHAIGNFVSGIAALPRIVTLHDVQISAAERGGSADALQLDVTAKTYRYLDESEQAEAQQGTGPVQRNARPRGG